MRCVITVVGKDTVGILAIVSGICKECNVNVVEVTQSILQDMFCIMMMADTTHANVDFETFADRLNNYGTEHGLSIHAMHEDIFNSMHRI